MLKSNSRRLILASIVEACCYCPCQCARSFSSRMIRLLIEVLMCKVFHLERTIVKGVDYISEIRRDWCFENAIQTLKVAALLIVYSAICVSKSTQSVLCLRAVTSNIQRSYKTSLIANPVANNAPNTSSHHYTLTLQNGSGLILIFAFPGPDHGWNTDGVQPRTIEDASSRT
jgi:hypothetical protein